MRQRQDKASAPLCHTLDITRQEKTKKKITFKITKGKRGKMGSSFSSSFGPERFLPESPWPTLLGNPNWFFSSGQMMRILPLQGQEGSACAWG